jgi:DNA-binding CsgD family transcriptional regulator
MIGVTGAAGVGKSAIVAQVLAGLGLLVVRAQAVPWEAAWPLGVLRQITETDVNADVRGASDSLREQIGLGVPAVILIEDAHWADIESLRAVSSAVRSEPSGDLRAIVVFRSGEGGAASETAGFLSSLSETTVVVPPLDAVGAVELAATAGAVIHPLVAERLVEHTGGLARPIVDLALEAPPATWSATSRSFPAPREVVRRVAELVDGLTPPARRFVEAVAILHPHSDAAAVAAVAELGDIVRTVDEAERAGLLALASERVGTFALRDSMTRAAVLELMRPAGRSSAHERAAAVLVGEIDQLRHRAAARSLPDADLAGYLDAASVVSAHRGSWAESAELLTLAAGLTDDRGLREERVLRTMDALVGAGDTLAAAALIPEVDSFRETPLHNAVLGYLAVVRGRSAEAESRLTRAWNLVDPEREPAIAAQICQRWVLHSLARCRPADLLIWADRAIALVPADAPEAVEAQAIRGLGLGGVGRAAEAVHSYSVLFDGSFRGAQAQRVAMGRGWLDLALDRIDEARPELESGLPTDFLGGSLRISLWAHGWLGRVLFATGRWDDALDVIEQGLHLAARSGMTLMSPLLHWTASQVHSLRGDWQRAEESLRRGQAGELDYAVMHAPAALARAQHSEARGDYRGVIRALAPLARSDTAPMLDEPGFWPWADIYCNALVMEGMHDEADVVLSRHEARAWERGHRSTLARLGYARGRLRAAQGDLDGARESFEDSLSLLAELPLDYDRARVNFAYGQTLRRAGKRREAEAVIATARQLFAGVGATTYVERCDREINAAGIGARTNTPGYQLSAQEKLVADLVARGRSNRDVASELFISGKTVQYHLTRIYSKVGVHSRSELAAVWSQTGETPG